MQRHRRERQKRGGKTDTCRRMASSLGPWALKHPQTIAEASPESLLGMQNLRSQPRFTEPELPFNKISAMSVGTFEFEKFCFRKCRL